MIVKLVHINMYIIIIFVICPIYLNVSAQTIAKLGCNPQCGKVEIPYPFGTNKSSNCYAGKWFEIECRNNTTPYLKSLGLQVTSIDVSEGTVNIMNPIYHSNCGSKDAHPHMKKLGGSPFVYSKVYNKFLGVGCNNIALLQSNGEYVSACASICDNNNNDDITNLNLSRNECKGKSCCETSLPSYLTEYSIKIERLKDNQTGNHCSYAMIAYVEEHSSYSSSSRGYTSYSFPTVSNLKDLKAVSSVLEWEILKNSTLSDKLPANENAVCHDTNVTASNSGRRCNCRYVFGTACHWQSLPCSRMFR